MKHGIMMAAFVSLAAFAAGGRDMLISNGRLVNAMNAGGNMITNLPPEFWEGHGGSGGTSTNAVNYLIREYDTTNLTARIAVRTTTNDVNAIVASSNLCTVSAAQAMTNGLLKASAADALYVKTKPDPAVLNDPIGFDESGKFEIPYSTTVQDFISEADISCYGKVSPMLGLSVGSWGDIYTSSDQTLPQYLASLEWHPSNSTLSGYGISDAYTKSQIDGTSVTNGGAVSEAKAYADATITARIAAKRDKTNRFWKDEFTQWLAPVAAGGADQAFSDFVASHADFFYDWYAGGETGWWEIRDLYRTGTIPRTGGGTWDLMGSGAHEGAKDAVSLSFTFENSLDSSNTITVNFTRTRNADNGNFVVTSELTAATNGLAPKLTGRVYDFHNGNNFTKRVYEALTNVIQTLGGTVTNAPSF